MTIKRQRTSTKPRKKRSHPPHIDIDGLAAQQGVNPIHDIDELRGDFWPEDESIDEFIAAVRRWRREGQHEARS